VRCWKLLWELCRGGGVLCFFCFLDCRNYGVLGFVLGCGWNGDCGELV